MPRRGREPACGWTSPRCRSGSSTRRCGAISRRSSRRSASRRRRSCRGASRSRSAASARRRSCSAGSSSAAGLTLSGKIDRIDVDPFGARGVVQDYKSGKSAHSAQADRERAAASDPALHARPARPRRARAARRPVPPARRSAQAARPRARRPRPRRCRATSRTTTSTRRRSGASSSRRGRRRRRSPSGCGRVTSATTRSAASARPGATSGPSAGSSGHERLRAATHEQLAAVEAGGEVFVSAGAGTGKTAVLVERVVRAVTERGLDVDSILVITYTRRAAGELRTRIRAALAERGRHDLARELDGAWISTIHGFCARLLRAYPLAAGLDPRFRELDEAQAAVLRSEAFGEALAEFCAGDDPQRLELLATYGSDRLRRMLTSVYETLRAAGRELDLAVAARPELGERVDELRAAATALAADPEATERSAADGGRAARAARRATGGPDRLMSLTGFKARGDRAAAYCEALGAVEQAALDEAAARDRALLQELLTLFAERYAAGEGARVGARLRGSPARGARPPPVAAGAPRARAGALPLDPRGRVPGHEPPPDGDRRPAADAGDRALLRRRRVPVDLRLPPRRRAGLPRAARGRRAAALAHAQLPLAPGGARRRERALRLALRRRVPGARRRCRVPRPGLRPPRRAARHRQGELQGQRRPLAARRGARGGAARPRARGRPAPRRRARSSSSSPPAPMRSGTRTSCGGRGCRRTARPARATSASSRSSTCSCTSGCSRTATTTRRCCRCSRRRSSASRTTRSRSCAGSRRGGRSSPASSTPCRRGSPSATNA